MSDPPNQPTPLAHLGYEELYARWRRHNRRTMVGVLLTVGAGAYVLLAAAVFHWGTVPTLIGLALEAVIAPWATFHLGAARTLTLLVFGGRP